MNITMKHIGRNDAVEVDGNDFLKIGRLLNAGYRKERDEKTPAANPALPGKTNEPEFEPPGAAQEDGE